MQMFVKCENENDKGAAWGSEHSDFTITGRIELYQLKDPKENSKRNRIPIGLIFHSAHKETTHAFKCSSFTTILFLPTRTIRYNFITQSNVSLTNMDIPLSAHHSLIILFLPTLGSSADGRIFSWPGTEPARVLVTAYTHVVVHHRS